MTRLINRLEEKYQKVRHKRAISREVDFKDPGSELSQAYNECDEIIEKIFIQESKNKIHI